HLVHSYSFTPVSCQPEKFCQLLLIQLRADHTDASCIFRRSGAHFMLFRNHVKIDPLAVRPCNHSLCAEHIAVSAVLFQCLPIYIWFIHIRSLLSHASPKSSASFSSFSSAPITQMRPVYSGAPARTSCSSGTMSK